MDEGYEKIGTFQDLDHMKEEYDKREMVRKRKEVTKWCASAVLLGFLDLLYRTSDARLHHAYA